jgi:ATPase subunit of ABC transporter with duplicated ATPase domains
MMSIRPNLLLLDEPTNNLDLEAVRALGEALKSYEGSVVLASHDAAFVAETSDIIYHISKGELLRLEGGVDEYVSLVSASVSRQKQNIT